MKKNNKLSIFVYIYTFFYLLLGLLKGFKIIKFNSYMEFIILITLFIIIKIFSRKEYIRNTDTKASFKEVIFIIGFILLIYFLSGLLVGYSYNSFSYSLETVIYNLVVVLPPVLIIEYIRHYLIMHSNKSKKLIILITTLLILVNIDYYSLLIDFKRLSDLYISLFTIIVPSIVSGIAFTYIYKKRGLYSTIAYQLIYNLFVLYTPILPNYNYFIKFIVLSLIPILVCYKINNDSSNNKVASVSKRNYGDIILSILVFLILSFSFGLYKYKPISVMSNSMVPTFSRGDIVIYEQLSDKELKELKEKDIILFDNNGEIFMHRIKKVIKNGNTYTYITKGDASSGVDKGHVTKERIKGKYKFSLPYIGYPTVWFNESL